MLRHQFAPGMSFSRFCLIFSATFIAFSRSLKKRNFYYTIPAQTSSSHHNSCLQTESTGYSCLQTESTGHTLKGVEVIYTSKEMKGHDQGYLNNIKEHTKKFKSSRSLESVWFVYLQTSITRHHSIENQCYFI